MHYSCTQDNFFHLLSLQELLVTPVKITNSSLGHYMPKGKKEFVRSVHNYALMQFSFSYVLYMLMPDLNYVSIPGKAHLNI